MAKNTSTIASKITGSTYTAAEFEILRGFVDAPIQTLGTYAGATITIDGSGRYSRYTMAANMTVTFATSGHEEGNQVILPIVADGTDTLTFPTNAIYDIHVTDIITSGNPLPAGDYLFVFTFIAGFIKVSLDTDNVIIADTTAPTVSSATVEDADPDALVVVFDEAVTITDTTGLSLDGSWTGITIDSVTSGSGTNTLTLALSGPVANGESGNFVYGGTNNIIDAASNGLASGSTTVTNNVVAWTSFNGTSTYIKFGDILDSLFSSVDTKFSFEIDVRNYTLAPATFERLFYKFWGPDNNRAISSYIENGDIYFFWYGDGTNAIERSVKWTGALSDTNEHNIRIEYDGSIDTNDGLDRMSLYIDDVLVTTGKTLNSTQGAIHDIFDSTAQLCFGTFVSNSGTLGGAYYGGEAREFKVIDLRTTPDTLIDVPVISAGTDVSGNGNNGTFVA